MNFTAEIHGENTRKERREIHIFILCGSLRLLCVLRGFCIGFLEMS
jgi:hypothetical protein